MSNRIGAGEQVVVERRALTTDERLGDALFTGLRLKRGVDMIILSRAVWHRCLGRFGDAPRAISASRHPVETGWTPALDPAGDVAGQRGDVGLRLDLSLRGVPVNIKPPFETKEG